MLSPLELRTKLSDLSDAVYIKHRIRIKIDYYYDKGLQNLDNVIYIHILFPDSKIPGDVLPLLQEIGEIENIVNTKLSLVGTNNFMKNTTANQGILVIIKKRYD